MSFVTTLMNGILHNYAEKLVAFEHSPPTTSKGGKDTLLFIGGLGEGFHTIPYVTKLADSITGWSVVEVLISSSYKGWGSGSLKRDAEELASCVAYFRKIRPGSRVALMGHSTGCQDALEYLTKGLVDVPTLDGVILQAPVSDREAMRNVMGKEKYDAALSFVKDWIDEGKGEEIIPIVHREPFSDYPVCARRWYSLLAPLGPDGTPQGDDDYFSSDISEEVMTAIFSRTKTGTKWLFLMSGSDQFVPNYVDKESLLERWFRACSAAGVRVDTKNSGIVAGADHSYEGVQQEVIDNLLNRVSSFLAGIDGTCR